MLRTMFFKPSLRSRFIALTQDLKYLIFLQKMCKNNINCYCFKILIKRFLRTNELIIASKINSLFIRTLIVRAFLSKLLEAHSSKHLTII